ncbi:hypothetical protein GOODEAATRI_032212 [Goodea atripinnis]|uniref:Uncharacterized protein n=1 Tax=Goodea atripinnis TaxID=208336 RepID=A0ABV0P9J1_9TELE
MNICNNHFFLPPAPHPCGELFNDPWQFLINELDHLCSPSHFSSTLATSFLVSGRPVTHPLGIKAQLHFNGPLQHLLIRWNRVRWVWWVDFTVAGPTHRATEGMQGSYIILLNAHL